MSARIPVFVSAPTELGTGQHQVYEQVSKLLRDENLEARALGRSDFGVDYPLKEVYSIARHCSGGVILGFEQMYAPELVIRRGTGSELVEHDRPMPTPWNNLEAGLLFGLRLPLMVFRERGIRGGVFDHGVTEVFVQHLPSEAPTPEEVTRMKVTVQNWVGKVREHYRAY